MEYIAQAVALKYVIGRLQCILIHVLAVIVAMYITFPYSILTSSLTSGNEGVERIIEYDESIALIHEALDLTIMANQSILSVLSDINTVMSDNIASTAVMLLNMSTELLSSTEGLNHVVTTSLLPAVTKAREAYEQSENQTQNIIDFANILSRDLNKLARAVSTNEEFVNNTLTLVQNKLEVVEEIYESVSRVVPTFDQNVTGAQLCLDEVRMVIVNFCLYNLHNNYLYPYTDI